jgi:hypothetical protein
MAENLGDRLVLNEVSPAYWQVTIDNPPINMYDPRMFAAFNQLMDRLDTADELRVVVFDSAHPDYFIAHYDLEDEEVPDVPGAAEFTHWPVFVTRLAQSGSSPLPSCVGALAATAVSSRSPATSASQAGKGPFSRRWKSVARWSRVAVRRNG